MSTDETQPLLVDFSVLDGRPVVGRSGVAAKANETMRLREHLIRRTEFVGVEPVEPGDRPDPDENGGDHDET